MLIDSLRVEKTNAVDSAPFINLQGYYEAEFSFITQNDVDELGQFDLKSLQKSWNNYNYDAYLLYSKSTPIGLCVVNLSSQISFGENTKDIAEFYILPKYRNKGAGLWFAHTLFNLYPGQWEIRQLKNAEQARKFWLKTIESYTKQYKESFIDDQIWHGYLQEFIAK